MTKIKRQMSIREKLLERLPKKYHERVGAICEEDGLIDDCKYMCYCKSGWVFFEDYFDFPMKNLKEMIQYYKEAQYTGLDHWEGED